MSGECCPNAATRLHEGMLLAALLPCCPAIMLANVDVAQLPCCQAKEEVLLDCCGSSAAVAFKK